MIQRQTVNSRTASPYTGTTALAAFADRRFFSIQNLDTGALYVKFGTGATTSSYDIILKGGAGAADGSGGAIVEAGECVYGGIITVASSGTPSYVAYDL
jgi:hypothetical protein